MSNMSYCRFENTVSDLQDCLYALEEGTCLSASEHRYYTEMLELCQAILCAPEPQEEDDDYE